jgi:hypothetical protein
MTNVTRTPPLTTSVKSLFLNASSLGATVVLAAQAGMSIRVISAAIVATTATTLKFQSASTDISATWPLGANGGLVLPFNEHGWFQANVGEALNVNLGSAVATGVHINYMVL